MGSGSEADDGGFEPVFEDRPQWRRIYLGLPGMGQTVAPDWVRGTDDVMKIVEAAVAGLVPTGNYVACGYSYGGYLVRGLAASHPDRVEGLALVAPMIVAEFAHRDVPPTQVNARDDEFLESGVVQGAEIGRRTQEESVVGFEVADDVALERISASVAGTVELERQGKFERPVLFVTG